MHRFEDNIFGLIPKKDWLDIDFQVTRPNDPIDTLFGDLKTDNLIAQYQSIAAEYQLPVMAEFHGFDTQAKTTFRAPVDTHNIEKGLIKVKIDQSERLRALTRSGVKNDAMYDYVINDGVRLADQVITRTKVAKHELMAFGKVTIKENNLDLTVNYGVPEDQLQLTLDLSAEADIPAQLQTIIDNAVEKGITLTGIITSRANLTKIRSNTAVQKAVKGNIGVGAMVRVTELNAYLEEEFGISRIIADDLTYAVSNTIGADDRPVIETKRYFPKDKVTFFATNPGGSVGTGLWGDPPESDLGEYINLLSGTPSEEWPFVYIDQWKENDPAVLWTKASGLFMPVLFHPNSLFIATVTNSASYTAGTQNGVKVNAGGSQTAVVVDDGRVFTEAELNGMDVPVVKALAENRGYTITQTKKAKVITEFVEAQAAAQTGNHSAGQSPEQSTTPSGDQV